jgi:hypothetical protein
LNTHGVARGKGCEIPPPEARIGKKEEENFNHKQQRGVKEKKKDFHLRVATLPIRGPKKRCP